MAISQTKAITRLYNEVIKNGLVVNEQETIQAITELCEKKGQFILHVDSYWSFVKSIYKNKPCIRMIFSLKETSNGKVQMIDRIIELIKNIENILIFVDALNIQKNSEFTYLDVIKNISE